MTSEEVRLRALLSIKYNDNKYLKNIPSWMQFAGLYPNRIRPIVVNENDDLEFYGEDDTEALNELKERLDKEYDTKGKT
jgi:hypothetical protein